MMLEKASQAAHKLSYKGIFVYQSGSTVNSMQITHMNYAQGGEFAHLVSLDGQPREVLRQGNEVVIYSPRSEKVLIERRRVQASFPAVLPGLTNMLKVSYQVRNLGFERVGGREAVIVFLEPKDQLRYGYRFYVDKEYGLLLKSVMLNEHGQMLEQVAFNQLVLMNNNNNSQKMDWFRPEVARGKAYIMQPEEKVEPGEAENEVWAIAELPAGFRKVDQILRLMPGKTSPVQQLVFSDGMASVSLFIEPLEKNVEPKQGLVTQGGTSVYALVVDGYQEIVVGEVPEATVRLIADAITFKK
ncbi:MAG: MucB/RseB C-terminal domain-containing protein [Methylobacillus sp.]|nr:MucB/RseB C-terminal domain-containing protein [Methylobacillus sp.]